MDKATHMDARLMGLSKVRRKDGDWLPRFWAKVMPEPNSGCWLWMGNGRNPYGQIKIGDRLIGAHRVSYEIHKGPIPEGLQIDHLCRVPCCVNPDHLEAVTCRENLRRSPLGNNATKFHLAKTHCPQGHPYSGDNLVLWKGWRYCRTCQVEYKRAYKQKVKNK